MLFFLRLGKLRHGTSIPANYQAGLSPSAVSKDRPLLRASLPLDCYLPEGRAWRLSTRLGTERASEQTS